jgi:hypothetical protein
LPTDKKTLEDYRADVKNLKEKRLVDERGRVLQELSALGNKDDQASNDKRFWLNQALLAVRVAWEERGLLWPVQTEGR